MSRPRKEIDKKTFEALCRYQCTLAEISGIFDVSEDTIRRFCKREYGKPFDETWGALHKVGLMSLRRAQFKIAETNATMAIWLGKQYLGQSDKSEFNIEDKIEIVNDVPNKKDKDKDKE